MKCVPTLCQRQFLLLYPLKRQSDQRFVMFTFGEKFQNTPKIQTCIAGRVNVCDFSLLNAFLNINRKLFPFLADFSIAIR